ncbi:Small subunit (SSU) processome component [Trapelia coarctata]|nr:Small subunit (SSU) processome component [Trapelia coarctata]
MVSQRAAGQTASKTSSAAAPATSSSMQGANKTAITRSAFSPSRFQLSLFASVIQGLESDQLRIHDTNTGHLKCDHEIGFKARITCLQWGYCDTPGKIPYHNSSKKKRKRSDEVNGVSEHHDAVVAVGTNQSEIHMFSPSEGKIVSTLKDGHTHGISDFKFVDDGTSSVGWSLGGDSNLVEWNLLNGVPIRTLLAPKPPPKTLLPLPSALLCASNTPYIFHPEIPGKPESFKGAFTTSIHSLIAAPSRSSGPRSLFLAAADSGRYISLFDMKDKSIVGSLVALGDVDSMTLYECPDNSADRTFTTEALAAVTKQGEVALFISPFDFDKSSQTKTAASMKPTRGKQTHDVDATIKMGRLGKAVSSAPILAATFEGNYIVVAWVEGGLQLSFDRVPWCSPSTGEVTLRGLHQISKVRSSADSGIGTVNGVKQLGQSHVDESRTVVAKGGNAHDVVDVQGEPEIIQISSAEEEESESEEELDDDIVRSLPKPTSPALQLTNGAKSADGDIVMEDAGSEIGPNGAKVEEPTFGDLLRANAHEVVDVAAAFPDPTKQALAPLGEGAVKLPSGLSLGTVLTQSLRTNDVNLLETCFHVQDLHVVRATIERLDSSLATNLLQKLAERLHSRPGRAGSLMVWVQWTLVAHGGYLAGQPEVVQKLRSLHRVVKERASSLQPLLSLKGKLDMLEAQMNLRKSMQSRFGVPMTGNEDDDDGVIYVEGQEEPSSEDGMDIEADVTGLTPKKIKITRQTAQDTDEDSSDSDDEMDDIPTDAENEDMESNEGESESDGDGLIDDEASESDGSSEGERFEDEVDHEDVDSMDEDEESETETPALQTKKPKLSNGTLPKRR